MNNKELGLILAMTGLLYFIMILISIFLLPFFVPLALIGVGLTGIIILLLIMGVFDDNSMLSSIDGCV